MRKVCHAQEADASFIFGVVDVREHNDVSPQLHRIQLLAKTHRFLPDSRFKTQHHSRPVSVIILRSVLGACEVVNSEKKIDRLTLIEI